MKGKRRWIEHLKSLLILLLSASAIFLLTMTPLVQDSGVLDLLAPSQSGGEQTGVVALSAAARPSCIAVGSHGARYGIQYDQEAADALFTTLSPLLGEALATAESPKPLNERQWQRHLKNVGIYFDFASDIPLSALCSWLQQEGDCTLAAAARRLLLTSGPGDEVLLCYQDGADGKFYACITGLTWTLHLEPVVGDVAGNGAYFAFEGGGWAEHLKPYTLISGAEDRMVYTASIPMGPGMDQGWLLEALDYTGRNHAEVSGGDLYLDGSDRLRILSGGQVIFDAAAAGKYPVATAGTEMTVAEAIEAARKLAEATVGAVCGDGEIYLVSAQEEEDGLRIRFGYRLDGVTVWLYDEGWCADFLVCDGYITQFTLCFRSYIATEEEALLLSVERAAVMLPSLTGERSELVLQYRDRGESTVVPTWVARTN